MPRRCSDGSSRTTWRSCAARSRRARAIGPPGTSSSATGTPAKGLVWMRARCTPLTGADGSLQWHGFINDITQRRRPARAGEANEQLRARSPVVRHRHLGVGFRANRHLERRGLQDLRRGPSASSRISGVRASEDRERVWIVRRRSPSASPTSGVPHRRRTAGPWISNHGLPTYDEPDAAHHDRHARDITARKEADEQLRKFAFLVNNSRISSACATSGPAALRQPGGPRDGRPRRHGDACRSVEDYSFPRTARSSRVSAGRLRKDHGTIEIRFRHFETDEPIWMSYSVFTLKDEDDRPLGFATISQNIDAASRTTSGWSS